MLSCAASVISCRRFYYHGIILLFPGAWERREGLANGGVVWYTVRATQSSVQDPSGAKNYAAPCWRVAPAHRCFILVKGLVENTNFELTHSTHNNRHPSTKRLYYKDSLYRSSSAIPNKRRRACRPQSQPLPPLVSRSRHGGLRRNLQLDERIPRRMMMTTTTGLEATTTTTPALQQYPHIILFV